MQLNLARYQWEYTEPSEGELGAMQARFQEAGIDVSPAFLRFLFQRGIVEPESYRKVTDPTPQVFHDPFLMYDMSRAVERIQEAIASEAAILVYGDYDADGITSTLIMYECLESLGAHVTYYLPNRHQDGYGPNLERYREFIEQGIELIITVDNGVAGFEAIAYAKEQGVDVIVTDHHELQDTLPDAYAIVHPRHPEGAYPFGDLAGAGVALKLAAALLEEVPVEGLELAAIGTIADMVSLTDENRTIVLSGLNLLKNTPRIGLQLLFDEQNIQASDITTDTIGFVIGPRLNSLGRLGDPTPGLKWLQTYDEQEAQEILNFMNEENARRQAIVQSIEREIIAKLETASALPDVIIEGQAGWAAGVLGIVASRLVERYHRPVLLFEHQTEAGVYKGSGRSIQGINLFEWLNEQKEYIAYFGGHSQAAGLTVDERQWTAFKEAMETSSTAFQEIIEAPDQLTIDLKVSLAEIDEPLIEHLSLLGPFGMDNPRPLVYVEDATITSIRAIGQDQSHIKLNVAQGTDSLQVIGFSKAEQCHRLKEQTTVSLVGYLDMNEWNNQRLPQLQLEDIGLKGSQWLDLRGSRLETSLFEYSDALYVFTHTKLLNYAQAYIKASSKAILYEQLSESDMKYTRLVVVEPPKALDDLRTLLEHDWQEIHWRVYIQESKYLAGLPDRQDASKLFRYIQQRPQFEIRPELASLSQQLNISSTRLKLLILMFYEAEFVIIKDGWLAYQQDIEAKVNLTELDAYQAFEKAMEIEALLNYQPLSVIQEYFEGSD